MTAPQPAPAAADARGVVVDAQAFATVRDMFSGGWCMKRNGEPCGESDCGQCDFDKWVDELIATSRPLPTAAGAVDLSALGEIRAVADTLGVCGSGTGATKMRQMATALRAACDALASATPAVPVVDRVAFEVALEDYDLARDQWEFDSADYDSDHEFEISDDYVQANSRIDDARAALLALVFPDAPAPAPDAAGENGGGR